MTHRLALLGSVLLLCTLVSEPVFAQKKGAKPVAAPTTAAPQALDEEYTKLIKQYLQDPRITTELVDHMPASATVPSPLKFFGRIPGTPGELTYAKDIYRYYEALAKASPRAFFWKIGQTEEGRDQVLLAIADEATIKDLGKYKTMLAALTDPRKTTEEQARQLIKTAKPIYWLNSGIHSPETGGPEMLIELAYRLIIEETPFIQAIRNNVITFITPVIEVDGRERQVDTYYYGKQTKKQKPPLMYWGKYVAHDNNRDGMGQYLKITQNITRTLLEWHPTILHDLHEAQSYLYISTGTGPYNNSLDPIQVNEWWLLAETETMEMAKRGVPGVWTYGFYDGWVPNYLFWIAMTHNAFGRFYEVQSYGPDVNDNLRLQATVTSREWFRPNPPLPSIKWGPRNNTNIQESTLLFALHQVATSKELYLENYWMKNKRSVEKGKAGPTYAWLIPAAQRRRVDAADMVNSLRQQGLEVHQAGAAFKAGNVDVAAGDYIVRADQPYRTLADMYFSVQNYPAANPRPYDDTGWTMQYMRNVKLTAITDKAVLDQPMTLLAADAKPAGAIAGTGGTIVVDHTTDNALMAFRFRNRDVKMLAAEDDFVLNGHKFRAGAFIVPNADRAKIDASIKELGLSAWAVASAPEVKTHSLDVPRIGYVHAWQRTQDEGWTRAALDHYGVPYTYFADQKLRDGNLRAKYDVIIFPHVGGSSQSHLNGIPKNGPDPIPYKKSDLTPNLGVNDSSDDIRGGMGIEGLAELAKFVQEGGTLITDGSTSAFLADYGLAGTVTVEHPTELFARGSILRGMISDAKSPIAYGYEGKDLPVYFNQDPVLNAGGGFGGFGGGGGGRGGFGGGGAANAGLGQNVTPNAVPVQISPLDPSTAPKTPARPPADDAAIMRQQARQFGIIEDVRPRVVMQFPANPNDMLLSGTLAGGQAIASHPLVLDTSVGKGHIVLFALRPFWRWQTQGTYFLAFNAILNWNHLDAGKQTRERNQATPTAAGEQ
ncbi:MAG TPA: M14 family zinc carboxypeptidase [Bryobacteraceae bacterium]|nr:M14 family zinc carboxypeptidase [Bryobacteraceae bacterium]